MYESQKFPLMTSTFSKNMSERVSPTVHKDVSQLCVLKVDVRSDFVCYKIVFHEIRLNEVRNLQTWGPLCRKVKSAGLVRFLVELAVDCCLGAPWTTSTGAQMTLRRRERMILRRPSLDVRLTVEPA